MKRLILGALIVAGIAGWVHAANEGEAMEDLKNYYSKEKTFWDNYVEKNCPKEAINKKCDAARGMQETYVYLLTDLVRDKNIQRRRQGDTARQVYEVPAVPSAPEETAALSSPQTAAEDIP